MTTCPPLRIRCDEHGPEIVCRAVSDPTEPQDGEIRLGVRSLQEWLEVRWVKVRPLSQRCGVATKLYEKAAELAGARGLRLVSDTRRTKAADEFWRKQVSKGRAECLGERSARDLQLDPEQPPCARYGLLPGATALGRLRAPLRRRPRPR